MADKKLSNREICLRPLAKGDLKAADRIFRLAFGTLEGLPDPLVFGGDADFLTSRWEVNPPGALGAEVNGQLVGCNFVIRWGSVGIFGPLIVLPNYWERGIGSRLLEETMKMLGDRTVTLAGLFTNPSSPKHLHLYYKYGYRPRFLTPIMACSPLEVSAPTKCALYAESNERDRQKIKEQCRTITNAVFEGLDVTREIKVVFGQKRGDTVLVRDGAGLVAFAVCHCGAGTEAGSDACYVKFGAALPGPKGKEYFARLLDACISFAARKGASRLIAGVNTARTEACQLMLERGFRIDQVGIAMHRYNREGYNRSRIYVMDDWR